MGRQRDRIRPGATLRAAVVGAMAFTLGYGVVFSLTRGGYPEFLASVGAGTAAPARWQYGAWQFYAAHFVEIETTASAGTATDPPAAPVPGDSWSDLYYGVPAVSLLLAGLVSALLVETRSVADAAIQGAAVVVGYLPLVVLVGLMSTWTVGLDPAGSAALAVGPNLLTAVTVGGLVYPLVLGGAGGLVGGVLWPS